MVYGICNKCGKVSIGRSPTGDWCNYCGEQDPCPCYVDEYCPSHDPAHKHEWNEEGRCKTKDCPAKKHFHEIEWYANHLEEEYKYLYKEYIKLLYSKK